MPEKIDRKLKTALDETRLLILGVQILLGFEFQSVFQDGFEDLAQASKSLCLGSMGLIVSSIAMLVAPSMQHRLVEAGQATPRLIRATNRLAGLALLPLAIGLALSVYVVAERTFGTAIGIAMGRLPRLHVVVFLVRTGNSSHRSPTGSATNAAFNHPS